MTGYQHISTQISSKHRVFLQLTWCISEFMTLPKRVEFCAGSRHIWGSPNVTFPKALTWKIAWRGLRPPLVAQEIIARTTGIMSVSATPEPFLTAGSKGKMSSSKLFSPIYCRDFSRTMSPFCFNVCNWCAEYLGFSAIRTIVFHFPAISNLFEFLLSNEEWPTQISDHLQIHYVPSWLNICKRQVLGGRIQ